MGTECAIAFASNTIRRNLHQAVLLDLKKTFDLVPRAKRQRMVDQRLSIGLARQVRALLWFMVIRTKNQTSKETLLTRAGVPQVDPTSSQLFSNFTDSSLAVCNERSWKSLTSLFVDDVLGLAKTRKDLSTLLSIAQLWAKDCDMWWNIHKSCGPNLPVNQEINGVQLPIKEQATYLGVTFTNRGVADGKLRQRISTAMGLVFKLKRTVNDWKTSVAQRRNMVKTFIHPITDYLFYLQPL